MRPGLRAVMALLGGAALLGVVAWTVIDPGAVVRAAMAPRAPFDPASTPAAPDYHDDSAWSALPWREDAGDAVPAGVAPPDQGAAPADVFYVHPTSYVAPRWNGPYDDPALVAATDRVATGIQAPAFNARGAVWAPRYRQATGYAFLTDSPDASRAIELAYDDVRRAFRVFQARRGVGRPFVLAGHSQGAVLAERLLVEEIVGTDLASLLVVAVLPGGRVTAQGLADAGVTACSTPEETGCVVAWNARGPEYVPGPFELRRVDARPRLCTNPLTWRLDGARAPASANRGAVFLEDANTAPRPGFADAQCVGDVLVVRELGAPPRDLPSRVLDAVLGPENYHPIELQLWFMDLRENVAGRVDAWLARRPDALSGGRSDPAP